MTTYTIIGTCTDGSLFGITVEVCEHSADALQKVKRALARDKKPRVPRRGIMYQSTGDGRPVSAEFDWAL